MSELASVFFAGCGAYFAWRAFKYLYMPKTTDQQNREWLDAMFPEHRADNDRIAEVHRKSMVQDYLIAAAVCAVIAYAVGVA